MTATDIVSDKIIEALSASTKPLNRTQLATATGLTYNTIKLHLDRIKGVKHQVASNGANVYSLTNGSIPSGVKLRWHSKVARASRRSLEIDILELPDVVGMYERLSARIPMALPARLKPDDDPREMAEAIGDYAIFLASVAARLTQEQDNPGWYEKLGGDEGYFTIGE
jgi:hypothetical protein